MKKFMIALAAVALSFTATTESNAQCNPVQYCPDFGTAWDGVNAFVLTDPTINPPAGQVLFGAGTENTLYISPPLQTGNAIIFEVEECNTYFFQLCGLAGGADLTASLWSFTGAPQGNFNLVASDDDGCGDFAGEPVLVWDATYSGEVILTINNFVCGNAGNFYQMLLLEQTNDCLANDDCIDAIELACEAAPDPCESSSSSSGHWGWGGGWGYCSNSSSASMMPPPSSAFGTTVGATCEEGAGTFCGTSITSPGVWYKVTGNGQIITANTCSDSTNFDTKLSVFTGGCDSLVCVAGNDDDFNLPCTNFQSAVSWCANDGEEYYILVHGFGAATGDFEIAVSCEEPSADELCDSERIDITCGGTVTAAFNNICATADGPSPGAGTDATNGSCNSTDGWCDFETDVDNDIWFCFIAPEAEGTLTIDAGDLDFQLAVWDNVIAESSSSHNYWWCSSSSDDCAPLTEAPDPCDDGGHHGWGYHHSSNNQPANDCQECCPEVNNLVLVGANDDSGPLFSPSLTLDVAAGGDLEPGKVYFIQIDGFAGTAGAGTLSIKHTPNDCADCCENNNESSYSWGGGFGFGWGHHWGSSSSSDDCGISTLTVDVTTDLFGGETSWTLTDICSGEVLGSAAGGTLAGNTTTSEKFCVPSDHCFAFEIGDSFGDGICCSFGNGSYEVALDGVGTGNVQWGGQTGTGTGGDGTDGFAGQIFQTDTIGDCEGCNKQLENEVQPMASNSISLSAYPNPIEDYATFEFMTTTDENAVVEVVNINGEKAIELYNGSTASGVAQRIRFDASELASGIYFVQVRTASDFAREKIVVIK